MFGIDQISIDNDVKDAAPAFDQFCFNTCCLTNCVRQTGGLGGVVSLDAVCDADLHSLVPPLTGSEIVRQNFNARLYCRATMWLCRDDVVSGVGRV